MKCGPPIIVGPFVPERIEFGRSFLPERTSRRAATSDQKRMKNQQPVAGKRTSTPMVRLAAKVLPGREDLHQSLVRQFEPNVRMPRVSIMDPEFRAECKELLKRIVHLRDCL